MRPRLLLPLLVAVLACAGPGTRPPDAERVDLVPEDEAGWGAKNLFAPLTGFFLGGPGYWYGDRWIEVRTTPPGATLDLFYVRAGFQKRYEQADAPAVIELPSRVATASRDVVHIRALLNGYRQEELYVPVRSREHEVVIELEPLPNALQAMKSVYLGGRGSLTFLTDEALTFRVQEAGDGFRLILLETALGPEAEPTLEGVRNPLVESVEAQQLGEDLLISVDLAPAARGDGVDLRSRQAPLPVRDLHAFSLDLVPPDGGAEAVRRARAALERIGPGSIGPCQLEFERALRRELDRAALARALAPSGDFTDPYLRAAMQRLGEVSGGAVRLSDGTEYRVAAPIELSAASSQAEDVQGYLAFLRRFVRELEPGPHRAETLRGIVAPETAPARFEAALSAAETRERTCLASR